MNIIDTPKSGYIYTSTCPKTGKRLPLKQWFYYCFVGEDVSFNKIKDKKTLNSLNENI